MSLDEFAATLSGPLEAELRHALECGPAIAPDLVGMLRYHMGWADAFLAPTQASTGKRIRPLLCLIACEACGGDAAKALPAAAAIELLHNFSLIHDDIEDGDRTRRGRPTLWALWGLPKAINAGDALFAIAQLTILRLLDVGVSLDGVLEAVRLLNVTSLAITHGQHLDIGFEQRDHVSASEYQTMVENKTAALIAASCETGALVAADTSSEVCLGPHPTLDAVRSYGRHLGLAFQMQDDVLGIWGDPAVTGKPAGADLIRRKKSLPILLGLERSEELRALMAFDGPDEGQLAQARRLLEQVGCRRDVEGLASDHFDQAMSALQNDSLAREPARALTELARRLLGRAH